MVADTILHQNDGGSVVRVLTPGAMTTHPETRKTISLTDATWARIEAYQERKQIRTQTEVLRRLILDALEADEKREARRERDSS